VVGVVAVVMRTKAAPAAVAAGGPSVITPAQAEVVVRTFWPVHEHAIVTRDVAALRKLETGAAAAYEPGAVMCGCLNWRIARRLVQTALFVPRQPTYPAHFMAEALSYRNGEPWIEIYVFTKQNAAAPWLVALNSGMVPAAGREVRMGIPDTDAEGYLLPVSAAQSARAATLPQRTAQLWQDAKETGVVPAHPDLVTGGLGDRRLAEIAAHRQGTAQANGVPGTFRFFVDRSDPLWEFNDEGNDIACRAVRETAVYTAPRGYVITQPKDRSGWGATLPPGRYPKVSSAGAWQTCFIIPADPSRASVLLNRDTDGPVRTG
jgi:hypothetical protein